MMNKMSKYLLPALFLGFLIFGLAAFMDSKPSQKNERVYKAVQQYSPYYFDKRFGGLQIMNREDPEFKEKPNNMTVFKEFERLEKAWGKKHLKLEKDNLIILDNNGEKRAVLPLQNRDEIEFVHRYYGV
jgi:hypothetical protein